VEEAEACEDMVGTMSLATGAGAGALLSWIMNSLVTIDTSSDLDELAVFDEDSGTMGSVTETDGVTVSDAFAVDEPACIVRGEL
jgi:hypothetical protein